MPQYHNMIYPLIVHLDTDDKQSLNPNHCGDPLTTSRAKVRIIQGNVPLSTQGLGTTFSINFDYHYHLIMFITMLYD